MKLPSKIILLAAGTAVLSSAVTAGVMKEAFTSRGDDFSSAATGADYNGGVGGKLKKPFVYTTVACGRNKRL